MIDITFWLLILIIGFIAYFFGIFMKVSPLFFLGCALIIGSGILLWGGQGLLLYKEVASISVEGVISYNEVGISINDIGLQALALVLISAGILSVFIFDFSYLSITKSKSPFHY